jgi:hypothetical protein
MTHLIILRALLVIYVMSAPYIFIYLQQSLFKDSFDDWLGNKLILRLQLISNLAALAMFLATFDWGREILQ